MRAVERTASRPSYDADTKEQQDSLSSDFLPLTLPSNGLRDAREHRLAQLKSGPWRLKPCGEDFTGE